MLTDTVTIRVEPQEGSHLSVNPSEMTFTQENWNRGRRVNVLAMEDGDTRVNSPYYISHSISGGDYYGVAVTVVSVTVTDTTVPEITVSPARASEGSGELEFLVSLTPSLDSFVDVQYELIDGTALAGSDYTRPEGGAQTLRFQAGQTAKTVRVPVTDDGVDEADEETFTLRLTDVSDKANLPGEVSTLEVQGIIEDNDATPVASVAGPGGAISLVSESVGTVTFTITLAGSTTEVVSVDYSTGNLSGEISSRVGGTVNAEADEDYDGVEGTVEFQPGETTKTVTVNVTNDDVSETIEYFAFVISNPRNAYLKGRAAATAILDNDRKGVVVTPISLMLTEEGAAGSYTVRLATEPTENVTVTIGGLVDTDVAVDETSLLFTPDDWGEAQTVEVTARGDDDAVNDTVTLTHTVAGGDYDGLTADGVTVTVTDNDTAGLVLSETALTTAEGSSTEYTVKLASEPADTVEVSFGIPLGAGLTAEPESLTFNVNNWSDEQRVEITALPDDDASDDTAVITHMPIGGDYGPAHNADLSITVTDRDMPGLTISPPALTVDEDATAEYTVRLDTQPTDTVEVTITGAGDVSAEPEVVTFTVLDWNNERTVTVEADRDDDVTNDSVTLSHTASGGDYGSVSEDLPVTVTDNSAQIVLSPTAIEVDEEGEDVTYTVKLAALPTGPVTVTITGAENPALSLDRTSLDFTVGNWNIEQEVSVSADHDDNESDDEFTLTHTAGGGGYDSAPEAGLRVAVTDLPEVTVRFGAASYTVAESDDAETRDVKENEVTVTVTLNADPERQVEIPLSISEQDGASAADYSGVPANLTFESGDTEKTFTFTAESDDVDDDGESVKLGFGTMPIGVTVDTTVPDDGESVKLGFGTMPIGVTVDTTVPDEETESRDTATVTITDDDDPGVEVSFEQASYTVAESDDAETQDVKENEVTVTVTLNADPERTVTIPISTTDQDGASSADYSNVPESVTFNATETSKSFTFTAESDDVDDDDESVKLSFGTMPDGVAAGTTEESTVNITDDDDPGVEVSFEQASYTIAESDDAETQDVKENEVTVKVTLSADPERQVVIPISKTDQGGATGADYSGVPANVTFNAGDTEKTFTFMAEDDTEDDDDESVKLSFGTLPDGVTAGTTKESTVTITDDDVPSVEVRFGAATYTVAEGASVTVTVELSADPERTVTIPISTTDQDGASGADYSIVPESVTFESGETVKSFTFNATDDSEDDDGESVKLSFGDMPDGVAVDTAVPDGENVARDTATVSITDDDKPASVTVNFGASSYTVAEGGTVEVKVTLSEDPEMQVTVPISKTDQDGATTADYNGVPANVTFESGDTEKTFTFMGEADDEDDDGESVKLAFGTTLPTGVTAGDTDESTVSITDDDVPSVEVRFGAASYTVAEGASVTVTVELSADPERSVTIPISTANEDGASDDDYSDVPESVTFESGDTVKSFTFNATDDTEDDDGESVKLSFGDMISR